MQRRCALEARAHFAGKLSVCIHTFSLSRARALSPSLPPSLSLPLSPSLSLSLQRQLLLLQMQMEHKTKAKSLARLPDICVLDDKSVQEKLAKLKLI